jgi:hypothetical protein
MAYSDSKTAFLGSPIARSLTILASFFFGNWIEFEVASILLPVYRIQSALYNHNHERPLSKMAARHPHIPSDLVL